MEEKIQKIMRALKVDRETAIDIIQSDERIDKGEKLFELSQDQQQVEKQMRGTGTRVQPNYKFEKRARKADNDKRELIDLLAAAIGEGVEIINPEREFIFNFKGKKYKVVLSAPRS